MKSSAEKPDFCVTELLDTPILRIRDIRCEGLHRHRSSEEVTERTQLVYIPTAGFMCAMSAMMTQWLSPIRCCFSMQASATP
jgi:hypothetical protein